MVRYLGSLVVLSVLLLEESPLAVVIIWLHLEEVFTQPLIVLMPRSLVLLGRYRLRSYLLNLSVLGILCGFSIGIRSY